MGKLNIELEKLFRLSRVYQNPNTATDPEDALASNQETRNFIAQLLESRQRMLKKLQREGYLQIGQG